VASMSPKSVPFSDATTRYFFPPSTADQISVTGAATLAALSAGAMSSGTSVGQPAALILKLARDDATGGQPPKIASTYQTTDPADKSLFKCVLLVTPRSAKASPLREAHTR